MKDQIGGDSNFVKHIPNDDSPQTGAIYSIVGLGNIEGKKFQSTETEFKNQIMIFIELCFDIREFGNGEMKPLVVNTRLTRSLGERSNLYKLIKGFRGGAWMERQTEINWNEFMGNVCLVNLENKTKGENTYSNIVSISKVPKGMEMPKKLFNQKVIFDITDINPDWEQFILLYPWVQKIVKSSQEWEDLNRAGKIPKMVFQSMEEEESKNASANKEPEEKPYNAPQQQKKSIPKPKTNPEGESPFKNSDDIEDDSDDEFSDVEMPSL